MANGCAADGPPRRCPRSQLRTAYQMLAWALAGSLDAFRTGVARHRRATVRKEHDQITPVQLTARETQIRPAGRRRSSQPGGIRCPAVHEPAHRRVPPAQGLTTLAISPANSSTASCVGHRKRETTARSTSSSPGREAEGPARLVLTAVEITSAAASARPTVDDAPQAASLQATRHAGSPKAPERF